MHVLELLRVTALSLNRSHWRAVLERLLRLAYFLQEYDPQTVPEAARGRDDFRGAHSIHRDTTATHTCTFLLFTFPIHILSVLRFADGRH